MVSALVGSSVGDPVQAPGVYEGVANVIAAVMLLLEFGMLRQALVRDQIRLYMGAVRADLGAGHRDRGRPEPARPVRAGRAVRVA